MLPQLAVSAQGQKATVVRTAIENRIADIHVLKDTSATAIYDLHSANGVIVITPPSGQNGHTNIHYRNQFGFSFIVD